MTNHRLEPTEMPALLKVILSVVAGLLICLGIIGLLLPIIPGVLFLGLAAFVLARISGPFARYLDTHPQWQRWHRWQRSRRTLTLPERGRLALLLLARAAVTGLARLTRLLRGRLS